MTDTTYDVLQIGYGPVGQSLALMMGRRGRSVAVVERWAKRYPLPRAVCIDHEIYRILSANGMGSVLPEVSHRGPVYQWFNAEWKQLLSIDWSAESISGGAEVNFVHQPTLEEALDRAVASLDTVETYLGWEAISIDQDDGVASATMRNTDTGDRKTLRARYIVGCDGANSLVREYVGGGREDCGFEADWLVIDVLLKEGVTIETLRIPAAGQYCNPARPTTIVPAGVRNGRIFRRWEFMRLPGERVEDLEREARVWELLSPWAGPSDVELVRHKIYNFQSRIARRWRDRRVLVAGDAAHVMPPFMGQGMCSGMRDAWNLSWKLDLLLANQITSRLLDSYQPERDPHVRALVDASIYLGRIICIPDPAKAAERDLAFLNGTAGSPPPFPHLTDGFLKREPNGEISKGAGLLAPHVNIDHAGSRGRFDDVVGLGFVILSLDGDPEGYLAPTTKVALGPLGVRFAALGNVDTAHGIKDLDGRFAAFMSLLGWRAMVIRPDFYVYGGVTAATQLDELLLALLADISPLLPGMVGSKP
jgi:2-polyprenyl-6-methoxyphenol hydroxylase-like FAD-dependent oxidoreductase